MPGMSYKQGGMKAAAPLTRGGVSLKIKITYTQAEKPMFDCARRELLQTTSGGREHIGTAPGGVQIWYFSTCNKVKSVVK